MKTISTTAPILVAPVLVALAAMSAAPSAAMAQQASGKGRLLDAPYITSTGATVPNPGKSQSGGNTRLDRNIQRENDKIDSSICKGC